MNNIITYAQNTLETFDVLPFSPVDSLILSSMAYIHFPTGISDKTMVEHLRLCDLYRAEYFQGMFEHILMQEKMKQLFFALAASPRYRDIRIINFTEQLDPETQKQFSATTFQLTPELAYVAYRGTDDSLIGWKEDFNMAFQSPIPSQLEAVRYLEQTASDCFGKIFIGGHSKGGNLAVYAAAMCNPTIQHRIGAIFSHDGPGFLESTLESREFQIIIPFIQKTLPQSSVVGMLLENQEQFRIVKSSRSGLLQHDPFSWIIEEHDFVYIDGLTKNARYTDKTLTDWLNQISVEDRERFIDALYGILTTSGMSSVDDLKADWHAAFPSTIHAMSQLDNDTKKFLLHTLGELASLGIKNFPLLGKP